MFIESYNETRHDMWKSTNHISEGRFQVKEENTCNIRKARPVSPSSGQGDNFAIP